MSHTVGRLNGFFIMKTHTIKIPIYHGYIHISIKNKLGKNCSGYVERDNNQNCVYWLVLKKSSLSHGLIVHEIVHLVNLIFIDRGIKLDLNNDEAQAYLTEWITTSLYKFFKDKKIPIKY